MSTFGHAEYGDAQKRQAQYNAALTGAARGSGLGLAVALPTAYILHQRWAPFRGLTLPLKAFFVTTGTVIAGVISADKAGIAFDREHYSDQGAKITRQYQSREDKEWGELPLTDKTITWAKDNKFSVVAGSWVASMGGIFAYIHNQPMSFGQKLVQTRVWAQGLTLASLLGMAAITQIPTAGDKILQRKEHASDHSWQDFIGDDKTDPSAKGKSEGDSGPKGEPKAEGAGGSGSHQEKPASGAKGAGGGGNGGGGDKSNDSKALTGGGNPKKDVSTPESSGKDKQAGGNTEQTDKSGSTSGDTNKSISGRSSKINNMSATNMNSSSNTNDDPTNKSSRTRQPGEKGKSQATKAPTSQTAENAGYNGNN